MLPLLQHGSGHASAHAHAHAHTRGHPSLLCVRGRRRAHINTIPCHSSKNIAGTGSHQAHHSDAFSLARSRPSAVQMHETHGGESGTVDTSQLLKKATVLAFLGGLSLFQAGLFPCSARAETRQAEAMTQLQASPATPSNPTRMEILNYRILQAFTLPGYGKILSILAIGMPFVLLGGFAYRQVTGDSWMTSITKSYYVLQKVPSEVSKESRQAAALVLNLIHLASIGTFAVVVGVFTSEIAAGVKAMRQGNFPLPESNHTVILGWSDRQSIIMLREMIESQRSQETTLRSPIVVLSDMAKKPAIDEQLLNEFGPDIFNQVIMTRQGNPTRPQDLARVAAGRAGTIIWMPEEHQKPQNADPDVALSATLTCLHAMRTPESQPQRLVVCEEGGGTRNVVRSPAGRVAAERLHSCNTTITRLTDVSEMGIMAQVALQPQLSSVFEELCQQHQGQVKFYTMIAPELRGKTFKQARKAFPNATLVGLVDSTTGTSYLTPPDSRIIGHQDQLVLLATCKSKLTCMPWKANLQASIEAAQEARTSSSQGQSTSAPKAQRAPTHKQQASQQQPQQQQQQHVHSPKNVFVLGHGPMKRIAASLQEFCGPGSRVTLLVPEDASFNRQAHALHSQWHNRKRDGVHFKVARGNLCSNLFLRRMGVANADAVLLGEPSSEKGVRPVDADAQVAASILQLQSLMETEAALSSSSSSSSSNEHQGGASRNWTGHTRPPLSVVSCVSNANMKSVLQRLVTTTPSSKTDVEPRGLLLNLIMAEELLGGMLTQVASDPMLGGVFEELLNDCAGAEVYIRNPREYGVTAETNYQWEEVQDIVRAHDAVAIGFRSNTGTVHLGMESREAFKLQENERLVVLSYN